MKDVMLWITDHRWFITRHWGRSNGDILPIEKSNCIIPLQITSGSFFPRPSELRRQYLLWISLPGDSPPVLTDHPLQWRTAQLEALYIDHQPIHLPSAACCKVAKCHPEDPREIRRAVYQALVEKNESILLGTKDFLQKLHPDDPASG